MNGTAAPTLPAISVVVPVRNEAKTIRPLLQGLMNQTLRPAEIVITDGGSTDTTRELIAQFSGDAPVTLISEAFALPGRARNVAVQNAQSEWIAFTDGGIRPERDWLENLSRPVADDPTIDVVYGTYEPEIKTFFAECAAIAYVPPPLVVDGDMVRPYSIVSALMRREVWQTAGGFPEHLRSAEDLLFMRKVEQAGFKIVRAARAVVHWNLQPGFWRTFRRFVAYSRNNIRAGLWREWQRAIFIRYTAILLSAIPVVFIGDGWLAVPLGLWLGLMIARAGKSIHRNRINYPAGLARNLGRLFVIVPILTTIDLAAFVGSIDWLVRDKLGRSNQ